MTRSVLAALALATTLAACGDAASDTEPTLDSVPSAVAIELPENPKVSSIEVGLAIDEETGRLLGGGTQRFPSGVPLFVGIRTHFVDAGAAMTVLLKNGDRTIETVALVAGPPDAERSARAHAELPAAAELPAGQYQVEVLLGDVSQGIRNVNLGS